jgi:hypothetical protein
LAIIVADVAFAAPDIRQGRIDQTARARLAAREQIDAASGPLLQAHVAAAAAVRALRWLAKTWPRLADKTTIVISDIATAGPDIWQCRVDEPPAARSASGDQIDGSARTADQSFVTAGAAIRPAWRLAQALALSPRTLKSSIIIGDVAATRLIIGQHGINEEAASRLAPRMERQGSAATRRDIDLIAGRAVRATGREFIAAARRPTARRPPARHRQTPSDAVREIRTDNSKTHPP